MKTISQITLSICAIFALAYSTAHAAKITSFSPQREIAQVRQISIKFDEAMVPMGDPNAAAPIILECEPGSTPQGQGRWIDEKNWVFDFSQDLPPGARCTAKISQTLKSINDNIYSGPIQYRFNTGGPFIQSIHPWEYQSIVEDQAFLLALNGDATAQSIKKHVWCSSSSVGERIPVTLIEGEDRNALMKLYGWEKASQEHPNQYWVVQCQRRFNANDQVKLVYDIGVETPTGIANTTKKTLSYNVREEFKANFSCTRENAQADCMPLAEMRLTFNERLTWTQAEQIRLKTEDGQEFKPTRAQNEDSLSAISFAAPFPEKTKFTIVLPSEVQDIDGRKLANIDRFPLHVATDQYPVLAKFAAAPFGLVELYTAPDEPAMIPLTVRNIEPILNLAQLDLAANRGTLSQVRYTEDADIIRWLSAVNKLHRGWISYTDLEQFAPNAIYAPKNDREWGVQTRTVS
ncbi:MAG: Ig-like domain-containing protein, partial [Saezia sp.]